MHTLIRSAARMFVHSVSEDGGDIGWYDVYETYSNTTNNKMNVDKPKNAHGPSQQSSVVGGGSVVSESPSKKLLPTKCVVNEYIEQKHNAAKGIPSNDLSAASVSNTSAAAHVLPEKEPRLLELADGSLLDLSLNNEATLKYYNKKNPDIIMVNLDHILQLIVDAMVIKTAEVEKKLKCIFLEGDTNKDGVLSFQEFTSIAQQAAPDFSQRKILKMFREALTQGK